MFVVLREPIKLPDHDILAVNVETLSMIVILHLDEAFQLAILKYFDAHFSNQSTLHCTLGIFDNPESCLNLFQEMIHALQNGDSIFDLRNSLI